MNTTTKKPQCPQMKINIERTKKVYPHSLVTPRGVGNYREYSPHFDKHK